MSAQSKSRTRDPGTLPVLTIDGTRATIRLNRPDVLNRIEPQDIVALMRQFEEVQRDPGVHVMVLTGTGRAFSSGYHLGDMAARHGRPAAPAAEAPASSFEMLTNRLEDLDLPTICQLNGSVYGGSTDLALACDFRIGVAGMEMFMPAGRLGLHYYRGGMVRYVTRLGLAAAKKLFLTGQTIDAEEMLRIGYLDQVVTADGLDGAVDALATALAGQAPKTIRAMKRTLNELARNTLDPADAEARHRESLASDEHKDGVAAFAQKRKPVFRRS